jgi:hypothetical protein
MDYLISSRQIIHPRHLCVVKEEDARMVHTRLKGQDKKGDDRPCREALEYSILTFLRPIRGCVVFTIQERASLLSRLCTNE